MECKLKAVRSRLWMNGVGEDLRKLANKGWWIFVRIGRYGGGS